MPTKKTRDGSTPEGRELERHNGADGVLKVSLSDKKAVGDDHPFKDGSQYEIPVTNVSWSRDYTLEEIQHNGSLEATLGTSEIRYSGSFEYAGQDPTALEGLVAGKTTASDARHIDANRPIRFKLTVQEFNHSKTKSDSKVIETTAVFKRVVCSTNDRDLSSGDSSTTSYDWQAETMKWYDGSVS